MTFGQRVLFAKWQETLATTALLLLNWYEWNDYAG